MMTYIWRPISRGRLPTSALHRNYITADAIQPATPMGLVARYVISCLATNPVSVVGGMRSAITEFPGNINIGSLPQLSQGV